MTAPAQPLEDTMTTALATTAFGPSARTTADAFGRTRLRLTQRGRRLVTAVLAVPLAIAIATAVLGGGAALASRDTGVASTSFETVTVLSGESLWSIAEQIAPAADPRDVIDEIVRLNGLESVSVSAGQQIAIPAEYSH